MTPTTVGTIMCTYGVDQSTGVTMRHICLLLAVTVVLSAAASAEDAQPAPEKVVVNTSVGPDEVRNYKIEAVVKGKAIVPDSKEPVDLDAAFFLKVRHKYSRREGDGLLPLDINLVEGRVTVQGQKIEITPSLYPKLTVLIDRDWRVTDIFGMSSARIAQTLPGINYGNHIILFYLPEGRQPHAVGETWQSSVKIPDFGETYSFANTLKGVELVDGVRAAVVRQEIVRPAKADAQSESTSMKATAESAFALDNGRLLKSHIECQVTFGPGKSESKGRQDQDSSRANIRIDISPA